MQCASGPVSKTVFPLQGTKISDAAYRGLKKKKVGGRGWDYPVKNEGTSDSTRI